MPHIKTSYILLASLTALSLLALGSCQCDSSKLYNKTWVLEQYGSASAPVPVIPAAQLHPPAKAEILLQFQSDKRFAGNDGCNQIFGWYSAGNSCKIRLDSIGSTLMMCQDSVMQQAGAIVGLLRQVSKYEVTESGLILKTKDKQGLWYRKK